MGRPGKKLVWQGREYTVTELARKYGLNQATLWGRLDKGISLEDALTTPPSSAKTLVGPTGERDTVQGWAKKLGISAVAIYARLRKGKNPADFLSTQQEEGPASAPDIDRIRAEADRILASLVAPIEQKNTQQGLIRKPPAQSEKLQRDTAAGSKPSRTGRTLTASTGETLTVSAWAKKLGLKEWALWNRIRAGWQVDEILGFVERPSRPRKQPIDKPIPLRKKPPKWEQLLTTSSGETHTIAEWAEKTGIEARIILRRISEGWSTDDAVEVVPRDSSLRIEWQGQIYSLSELARKYDMLPATLNARLKAGITLEDALTPQRIVTVLTASNGESDTIIGWAEKLGIPEATLRNRIYRGWEVDEVVGLVERQRPGLRKKRHPEDGAAKSARAKKTLTASNGETHTVVEWGKKLGIKQQTLWARVRRGWEADEILGFIKRQSRLGKQPIEWQGRLYSASELAEKHGISTAVLRYRLDRGYSLEEALTKPSAQTLTASNGETHTFAEWSEKLGISEMVIRSRVNSGWSVDEAVGLVERPKQRSERYGPPKRIEFQGELLTRAEIARRLGISGEALRQRLLKGWKPEDAFSLGNSAGKIIKPNPRKKGRKIKPPPPKSD